MSMILFLLIPLMEYFVLLGIGLVIALWLFKKKVTGDLMISSGAPICLWLIMVLVFHGKSLSNFVIEPLILAVAILVWEIVRLAIDGRGIIKGHALEGWNIAGSLLVTLCVLFLVPSLPE